MILLEKYFATLEVNMKVSKKNLTIDLSHDSKDSPSQRDQYINVYCTRVNKSWITELTEVPHKRGTDKENVE